MSRRAASAHPRKTKVTIPERVGPHVKLVFAEMRRQNRVYDEVEEGSGVLRTTIKAWRIRSRPSLESLEAVLGYLGFDFVPVPRAKVLPPEFAKRLAALADEMGATMPETIKALAEVVAGLTVPTGAQDDSPPPPIPFPQDRRRAKREAHPDQEDFLNAA